MSDRVSLRHRIGALHLDVDLPIEPGVTAIFGPSGAGKTSILRAVAGLLTPESGKIGIGGDTWFDSDARVNIPTHRRGTGYVFQEPRLFPHLSVEQNIRYGAPRRAKLDAQVALLGLGPLLGRRPTGLSGGEAQRVALARALLSEPRILLMDEPLSALDQALKDDILPYLEGLCRETALPILYVSHDIDEVARLADRIALLEQGRTSPPQSVASALADAAPQSALARTIAGGLLRARIRAHHPEDRLTEVQIGADRLWLPGLHDPMGGEVQLRIEARDVTLSLSRPEGMSALNVLPVRILRIDPGPGSGVLLRLDHEGQSFAARLTARSARLLSLSAGQSVFAVLKTMSVTHSRVAHR